MPVELDIRPRIRMRPDFEALPRRRRWRLPRFALPVLAYWLGIGGICFALVHAHDDPAPAPQSLQASDPASDPDPAPTPAPQSPQASNPASDPDPAPTPAPQSPQASAPDPYPIPTPVRAALPAATRDQSDVGGALPSCEAAAALSVQRLDFSSSDRSADLPSSAIANVLENGAWLGSCSVPANTSLNVCVAIQGGRVTAATVTSNPSDASLNACVKHRAAALQFPYSTRLDLARTRF